MKLQHFSPSRAKTFEQCQLKYYALYELGLSEGEPHPLTKMGTAVHQTMQAGIEKIKQKTEIICWESLTEHFCKELEITKENTALAKDLVQNALDWGYLRQIDSCHSLEFEISLNLPDGTATKGIIDRLDFLENWVDIIDLKTQKQEFDDKSLKDEWQTRLYAWSVRKLFDIKTPIYMSYWVLRHRVQRCCLLEDDSKKAEEAILHKVAEIKECTDPKPNPSPLCQWCVYQTQCPAKVREVKDGAQGLIHNFRRKYK